ncbi:hypothetical protein KAJ27_06655 [bacterium]|nr:hypothetical protein [bacterium]
MIFYYINSKALTIPADNPAGPLTLPEAIDELGLMEGQSENNFIGFINSKDESIQFVYLAEEKCFLLDIPIIENGEYTGSKQSLLNKDEVIAVIEKFFLDE